MQVTETVDKSNPFSLALRLWVKFVKLLSEIMKNGKKRKNEQCWRMRDVRRLQNKSIKTSKFICEVKNPDLRGWHEAWVDGTFDNVSKHFNGAAGAIILEKTDDAIFVKREIVCLLDPYEMTSNIAELRAIELAIEDAIAKKPSHLLICSDSMYALRSVAGSTQPKKNQELIKSIIYKVNKMKNNGTTLSLRWVRGHGHHELNDAIDRVVSDAVYASI